MSNISPGAVWHKLNPAVLLAGALLLSFAIACGSRLSSALAGLALASIILVAARPEPGFFFRRLVVVNVFILFMFAVVPFTTSSPYIWEFGFLKVSRAGAFLCLLAAIKANAIFMIFFAFVAPMSITSLGSAMRSLGCPDKLAWLFLLMERNLQTLGNTWRVIHEAAALRGFAPAANLRSYRAYAAMLAIFFLRSYLRGVTLREALLLAGFDGRIPFPPQRHFGLAEFLFCMLICVCAFLVLIPDHLWNLLCWK